MAQLTEHGADLQAPRHVTFYLYFPSEQAADAAAGLLRSRGLEVNTPGPRPEHAAAAHGGEYDGWEAGVEEEEAR